MIDIHSSIPFMSGHKRCTQNQNKHFTRINTGKRIFIKDPRKAAGLGAGDFTGMRVGMGNKVNQQMKGDKAPAQTVAGTCILLLS